MADSVEARPRPAIVFENVAKSFGDVEAISGVDLEIEKGCFTVIVGPSGCGKSTLLALAAGLDEPSEGYAFVHGKQTDGPTPDTALLFQNYNLFPWLTALDNVAFGLINHGVHRASARAQAKGLLDKVGLGACAQKVPHELSGGMRQRVALVRAFALSPSLLLMDEPFAALDYQTRKIMQTYLLSVWQQSRATVVMVTHDLDEALYLADRLVLFTGSPGCVKEVIDIKSPRPRERSDPALRAIQARIENHLEDEAARGEFTREELDRLKELAF